ncbi:Uncharacterized protein ACMD2_26110 [Ananas comosus]|uniref:Remorin C-terminal domain-containing protein n=1 Tax=Ananas comosus TaxID=4615 RepID=A0A199V5X4_ANACO|nr:Uncharacterized protein ACMD2_26110 [Ananas comosus]
MDYERIEKPFSHQGGGGFSPKKLRAMLLGAEKRRKEAEEVESEFSLRSELTVSETDERRGSVCDECKDVDMVSSTSLETSITHRSRDPRLRSQDEDSFDSESIASNFEFHKDRNPNRAAMVAAATIMPPFSKPAPSKWDDAQKWIASPNLNRVGKAGGAMPKKMDKVGVGNRFPATKVVVEVTEELGTKRIDHNQAKVSCCVPDPYPEMENIVAESEITISRHDSSTSLQSATAFVNPPSTVRSVSMRDMGTEMTPIASEEPSRTGTPLRSTTPTRSPNSSRPSTPRRARPTSEAAALAENHGDCSQKELSEQELQMKIRREIMILGTQLGKTNIAAWASREEQRTDASVSLNTLSMDQPGPASRVIETRATAWEEAEKAKYLARFKQEEMKIQAWENHQKAKTEAEMRKIEVEVERMRANAHDRLMNKLAAAKHKAEAKRAAAEANRNREAAKTAQQAEYIRRTGRIPTSISCWGWCA